MNDLVEERKGVYHVPGNVSGANDASILFSFVFAISSLLS